MELFKFAKYPFMAGAKEWVKKEKIGMDEILFDGVYERARRRGVERVMNALYKGKINEAPLINEIDCMMEIFSYPIARMIAVAVESDYVLRRYALAEAKKAYELLKNEEEIILKEVAREFDIDISNDEMHFSVYLKYAPHEPKWKLVNRELRNGYVKIAKHEIARILQEAIKNKIYNELSFLYAPQEVKNIFREEILKIRRRIIKTEKMKGEASFESFPPCIKNLISAIKSGANIPHVGRFTLVTFLNAVGMSVEEILKIFSSSPDFNEEKTIYQIKHITGKISGTIYSTPKCSTIQTWGLCFSNENCKKIWHPLLYYKIKSRGK